MVTPKKAPEEQYENTSMAPATEDFKGPDEKDSDDDVLDEGVDADDDDDDFDPEEIEDEDDDEL